MTGWNMPPGCNVRDIPGNRPEDEAHEAMVEMVQNKLAEVPAFVKLGEEEQMAIEEVVVKLMGESWTAGQRSGSDDAAMATEIMMQGVVNRLRVIVASLEAGIHG